MKKCKTYVGRPPEGFYVHSSSGCGDDCAIRISHIECLEKTFELAISPEEALEYANKITLVALAYQKGMETEDEDEE